MEMLGAITGLIGAGLSASAQANQQTIEWANLQWQKQHAAQEDRFAQATRTDAYGNKQSYDPATNTWNIVLTPTQKSIINAGETEQLQSLTTDAQRRRSIQGIAYQRALDAENPYNTAVVNYKYNQPKSEAADRNELETLMLQSNQDAAKSNQGTLAREALRLGRGADIPYIIKASDDSLGKEIPNAMLQALQQAHQTHAGDVQQHDAQFLPEISKWADIVNAGAPGSQARFSDVPQQLDSMQAQQSQQIMQALQNEGSGVGGAYSGLAAAMGKSPDLSGIAKGLTDAGKSGKTNATKGPNPGWFTSTSSDQPWDANMPWGTTPDYLNNINWGGDSSNSYLF